MQQDVNKLDRAVPGRDDLTGLPIVTLTDDELAQVAGAADTVSHHIECSVVG